MHVYIWRLNNNNYNNKLDDGDGNKSCCVMYGNMSYSTTIPGCFSNHVSYCQDLGIAVFWSCEWSNAEEAKDLNVKGLQIWQVVVPACMKRLYHPAFLS